MDTNILSTFTDFFNDDSIIDDSQPLSLSSPNNIEVSSKDSQETILVTNVHTSKNKKPERGTGQKGQFRSIEEIDEKYRHVFTHSYFNLMQSRIIDDALYSDKSLVVCAPTGSGKTVLFEMAIVQLLMDIEDKNIDQDFKIIYMAPMKSLCTERLTEWYGKFTRLGLSCIEVTGDTDVDFPQLKPYRIIITTPEKWDMLTRRWKDHSSMVEVIKLFLIDEVHILNDEARGPVLEAVVSRMKTIESSAKSAHRIERLQRLQQNIEEVETPAPRIRFIAVSATVSNPEDVATWLSTADSPAVFYKLGDECRPVKLKLVVEGFPCSAGSSVFKFDIVLNYKLWPIIQKYHNKKPTLIFCSTRKSVVLTAETLSREITVGFTETQKARLSALAEVIKNKKIQALILSGVGCHHAGLLYEERTHIENAFRNMDLPILITTTTLAMGVNLPAHLVIIKNTQQYVNGNYQEYSISTILQMVGRAGRPQFDTEGTAVIMTRTENKARYKSLVSGSEPLQSYLHKRMAENLNSEAALGTVIDVAHCVHWVNSTFFSVRAVRDPRRYLGLPQNASKELITKKIEELCVKAMHGLNTAGLISMDETTCIQATDAGRIMSHYYIDVATMKAIMKVEGSESLEELLWLICESHELSDMHLRVDERRCLNLLNRNKAAATIRFPMKGKINSRQMKLNCVIQAVFGCLPILEPSLNQEAMKIMRIADRLCKCLIAYVTSIKVRAENPKCYLLVLNAITLAKCVTAHLWENSPYLSKQLKGIGPTFSSLLASAGKTTFLLLEESHPRDLERIMNKGPPAGNDVRTQVSLLPKYKLTATATDRQSLRIELALLNKDHLSENTGDLTAMANHKFYLIVGDSENNLLYYMTLRNTDLIHVYNGCFTCDITRKLNNKHKIMAHCISSNFVGIDDNIEFIFEDLNPQPVVNDNTNMIMNKNTCTPRETVLRQTNITDSFTRKRKNPPTTESKEKKRKETSFIKQFNNLRDSVGIPSKNIKEDFKKPELSDNITLNDRDICMSVDPEERYELGSSRNKFHDGTFELSEPEDWADDVTLILKEIEAEMEKNKENKNTKHEATDNTYKHPSSTSSAKSMYAKPSSTNKYKRKEPKNNFSFIDSIKRKCLANDEPSITQSDVALPSPIRDNLNRLLVNLQNKNNDQVYIDHCLVTNVPIKTNTKAENKTQAVENTTNVDNTKTHRLTVQEIQNTPFKHHLKDINLGDHYELGKQVDIENIETNVHAEDMKETVSESNKAIGVYMSKATCVIKNSSEAVSTRPMNKDDTLTDSSTSNHQALLRHHTLKLNPFLAIENPKPATIGQEKSNSHINSKLLAIPDFVSPREISVPLQKDVNNVIKILQPNLVQEIYKKDRKEKFDHSNKDEEDINQYFFSATKTNTCTKVLAERQLHIVSRVKVDMNITEIKTKADYSESYTTAKGENCPKVKHAMKNEDNFKEDGIYFNELQVNFPNTNVIYDEDDVIAYISDESDDKTAISSTNPPATSHATENIQNKRLNVKDILDKYQRKFNMSKNSQLSQQNTNLGFKSGTCTQAATESRKHESNPKKYRLKDLDKINIPFPDSLASVLTQPSTSQTTDNIGTALNKIKEKIIEHNTLKANETDELQLSTETIEVPPPSPKLDVVYEMDDASDSPLLLKDIDIEDDFELSQAQLNPKALLRLANDHFVPPPSVSTDTYSPTLHDDEYLSYQNPDAAPDINEVFSEQSDREEWILSRDENNYSDLNQTLSDNLSQRQTKLNNFKFVKKNRYNFSN